MPRTTPKIPENKKSQTPDTLQVVQLYGLANETRERAKEVNTPLNSLMFSTLFTLRPDTIPYKISVYMITMLIQSVVDIPGNVMIAKEEYPRAIAPAFIIVHLAACFMWYKFWKYSCEYPLKKFPNGIGFDKNDRSFHALQKQFEYKDDLEKLMNELRQFISLQYSSKNNGIALSVMICALLLASLYMNSLMSKIGLQSDFLGFYVGPEMNFEKQSMFEIFLLNMLSAIQRPLVYSPFSSLWSRFRTPKHLENYRKQLSNLSGFGCQWKLLKGVAGERVTKSNAVFQLDMSHFSCDKHNIKLDALSFMIELHRVLLAENIPVFISDESMYSCYFEMTKKMAKRIDKELQKNLKSAAHYLNQSENTIEKLTGIFSFIKKNELNKWLDWDCCRALGENNTLDEYYFLSLKNLPVVYRKPYQDVLENVADKVEVNGHLVTLKGITDDDSKFDLAKKILRQNVQSLQVESDKIHMVTSSDLSDNKVKNRHKTDVVESKVENADTVRSIELYPDEIRFSLGVTFIRDQLEHPNNYAENVNCAWPLNVPWLTEGRAYISIDPEVIAQVSPYLTSARILSRLQSGAVHGTHKSNKTKVGAVGVQVTNEAYQTVTGDNVTANFKAKDDNIRMFSQRMPDVTVGNNSYLHYRVNGWGFGH